MLTDKLNRNEAVVCVVGLGYVGLPLAIEFSKDMQVIGYEIDVRYETFGMSSKNPVSHGFGVLGEQIQWRD